MENRKWKIEKWKMTFTELYEQFVPVKRLEVKTSSINRYRMDWKYLEPKIGATDIADFGRQNARFIVATMIEEGLSPKLARDRIYFVSELAAAFKDIARRLDGLAAEIEAAADKD